MICDDVCIPGSAELSLTLPIEATPPRPDSRWTALFEEARRQLPQPLASAQAGFEFGLLQALLLALAGGVLLNLMPCVFPVLSLKAISLMEARGISLQAQRWHGIAYTAGVMLFFAVVAAILYLLKLAGVTAGWGFQLQAPWFVALLAYLLFVLGLGFSGLLEIGTRFMGLGESLTQKSGYGGSFFTGALAAVVASPCTAPFMGTAIAFAITQPPLYSLTIFLALGFGMAAPFLLIGFVPRLGRLLPRPGAWMNTFKQAMAFPLYLTALWLLWVLGRQTDATGMAVVLTGMLLIVFATWLRRLPPAPTRQRRQFNGGLALAAALGALDSTACTAMHWPSSGRIGTG